MKNNMDYIEYDGRKVPTLKTLQKQGFALPNGGIKNQKSKVNDADIAIPEEYLNAIIWNLQRYSSYTYIERMLNLLESFVSGYEKYLVSLGPYPRSIEELQRLYTNIAEITDGIHLFRSGYKKEGYVKILYQNDFYDFFTGRMLFENDYGPIGYRYDSQPVGLFSWINKVTEMYARFSLTLSNDWHVPFAFEDNSKYYLQKSPVSRDFERSPYKNIHATGETVPKDGIWNPVTFKSGCPNYLCAGLKFPPSEIAIEKIIRPEYFDNDGDYNKPWQDYNYEQLQCEWEILWEDTRYIDGTIPEVEAEYLDESTDFPADPPEYIVK